jgi:hypothetical protein
MNNRTHTMPGVIISTDDEAVPGDFGLLRSWFNVVRAMRREANTGSYAIVSINVIVNGIGLPLYNSRPKVTRLEPKGRTLAMDTLLETLAE